MSKRDIKPEYLNLSMSLSDISIIIAKKIRLIVIIPVFSCFLTAIYVLYVADIKYTANSKIMSSNNSSSSSTVGGLAAQFGLNLSSNNQQVWVYPEILKSFNIGRSMIKKKFNTKQFGSQVTLYEILNKGQKKLEFSNIQNEINTIKVFQKMISINEDLNSGIYTISITSLDAMFSADLNNALIEELGIYIRETVKRKTIKARLFIEDRIVKTRHDLEIVEEDLRDFTRSNRRIENSPALLLEQQRLSREVAVLTGVFTTLKQQYETTKIEELKESEYVIIVDPAYIPTVRSSPKRTKSVVFSGIFGLGISLLVVFFIDLYSKINKTEKLKLNLAKETLYHNLFNLKKSKNA